MEQPDELRALTRFAAGEIGAGAGGIGGVHAAIAGRVFRALGPSAAPVRVMHDAIAGGAYAAVRGGAQLAGAAAGVALARRDRGDGSGLSDGPRGAAALAVLTGLRGDALAAEGSALAGPMHVRLRGRAVAPAALLPGPRLVVLLHGLMETEHAWRLGGGPTYGERLARELGLTPVELRYNSGLHVSENGRALAELLDAWPAPVHEIALIGHSLGGLVARSACHQAAAAGMPWAGRVRQVVTLGTPHHGAPLAHGVHLAAHALHALPETRPFAGLLRRRSAGIRDLRHGSLVDRDWEGRDPDALRAAACAEVPLLPGATHCFVSASIMRDPRHPLGRLLGDALVLEPSAAARRLAFADGLHVGGAHHLALLNHPAVYAKLRVWLGAQAAMSRRSMRSSSPSTRTTGSSGRSGSATATTPMRPSGSVTSVPTG